MKSWVEQGCGAFPVAMEAREGSEPVEYGMSLRDWFAGMALTGLISQSPKEQSAAEFARQAYVCADAMIKARDK